MLANTQSIACAFCLTAGNSRSPYRHLELCGAALEAVFISISHCLAGLFAGMLRCFPLESVRIPAEKCLVYQQKFLAIQRTLLMKTTSYKTGSQGSKCFVKGHTNAVKAKKTSSKFINGQNDVKEKNHTKENEM